MWYFPEAGDSPTEEADGTRKEGEGEAGKDETGKWLRSTQRCVNFTSQVTGIHTDKGHHSICISETEEHFGGDPIHPDKR